MSRIPRQAAANEVYRLPPKLFDARCRACWFVAAAFALVVASFWSLDLQWAKFLSAGVVFELCSVLVGPFDGLAIPMLCLGVIPEL